MKRLLSILIIGFSLFILGLSQPALANVASPDPANGAKVFGANCMACHMGGGNFIMPAKTLRSEALSTYLFQDDEDPLENIKKQVTYGRNAMPAFAGRLNPDQIADVAAYVLQQSEKGW